MMELFEKVDSVILRNFQDYWQDPLINKYFGDDVCEKVEGFLILKKQKKPLWLSHPFNYSQIKKEYSSKLNVKKFSNQKELKTQLDMVFGQTVGYNARFYNVAAFNSLKKLFPKKKFIDVSEMLEEERKIKTSDEVKKIETAVKETKKVLAMAKKWLKKGITEKQLKKRIETKFEEDGFGTAFCIVAFGENTSNIHHISCDKKFSEGPVMIDVGAKYKGYCADITQSWFVGKSTKEYLDNEAKIDKCISELEKNLKPKTPAKILAKIFSKYFKTIHSVGHGIGIEVHDFPAGISEHVNWQLETGMVIAIEPGTYSEKFGIRSENNYLITKNGFRKL
jgi:Xaa-Pro dipeptidase